MARVLIVDDEPLIAMLAQDWLEDLGHQTVGPAYDLKSALALTQEPMDAAILDVSLGAEKSYEVARRLQELGVPFAFATGHDPGLTAADFADALTLPKPYSFETFAQVVSKLVARAGG